jgi:IS6 family transposase
MGLQLIKVKGKWAYYYRAIDKAGNTIDFYLSSTRNAKAAKRFLSKSIKGLSAWAFPKKFNTDKAAAYTSAIQELKQEGQLPPKTEHRQVKYLNNRLESDHGKLKRLVKPTLGFKSMKTAYATLKGFEVMRAFKKGQVGLWRYQKDVKGEMWLINCTFGLCTA